MLTSKRSNKRTNNKTKKQKNVKEKVEYSQLNRLTKPVGLPTKGPVPDRRREKLTYSYSYFLGTGTAAFVVYDLKLNCLVTDPTLTQGPNGVGAILGTTYTQYTVDHVNFLPSKVVNNTPGSPVSAYIILSDAQPSTSITTYADALNAAGFVHSTVPVQVGETTGNSKAYIPGFKNVDPGTIIGNPLQYHSDIAFSGTAAANPAQTVWFGLVLFNITNTTVGTSVLFSITVEFIVDFYSVAYAALAAMDRAFYESMRPQLVLVKK